MRRRVLVVLIAATLAASGCVIQEGTPSDRSSSAGPSTAPMASVAATASGASTRVDAIADLPQAVVQIETEDQYRDPKEGWRDIIGHGSGFIIDPAGLVLTNHHVVGELSTVTVFVGPDRTEYQGTVLAVAECSDLAVVELVGGDGFAWLDWHGGPIDPGLDVYAAGFPRGDPVYTLTGGIVSRASGVISENWAWVLKSIEHDANILGGSSGGPVVTKSARVVAINYAGNDAERRSIAISRDEVLPVLPGLLAGRPVASLGIDGEAIVPNEDIAADIPAGVWAKSVLAGSPAEQAGILPGDVLTELDGRPLADGTMADYCGVLRERAPEDVIPVTVYRPDDEATLTAEFNGSPIDPPFAFATAIGGQDPPEPAMSTQAYDIAFDTEFDDDVEIKFEVPADWQDVVDRPWMFRGEEVGPGVVASSDAAAFLDGWETPGVYVGTSDTLGDTTTVDALLGAYRFGDCTLAGRTPFARGGFEGAYDLWEACGPTSTRYMSIAATQADGSPMVYLQFLAKETADFAVLDHVITTLEVGSPDP